MTVVNLTHMLRHISALPALGRVLLACSLALLAFAFAMEAKVAWYGPIQARDASAAKAMPADTLALTAERGYVDHPVTVEATTFWLQSFAVVLLSAAASPLMPFAMHGLVPVSSRPHFSPLLFFRPPPARF